MRKRYDGDRTTDIYVDGSIVYNIISYKKGFKAAGLNYPTKCWCPHILTAQASNSDSNEDNYIVKKCTLWVKSPKSGFVRCVKKGLARKYIISN